jgi:hypothetical protein
MNTVMNAAANIAANIADTAAARFAAMTDEQLSKVDVIWDGERDAFRAERAKRQKRIDEERLEHMERLRQRKEAVTYSPALATEICERVSAGELLILICDEERMPSARKAYCWLKENRDFQALYNASLQDRLAIFEDQIIAISDDVRNDFRTVIKKGQTKRVPDPEQIARAKLRVETRIKYLRAFKPQRWAEQSTLNVKSTDDDPANMTPESLEAEIAAIEQKSRIGRVA